MITISGPTFSPSLENFRQPQGPISEALPRDQQIQFLDLIQSRVEQEYHLMSDFRGNIYNLRVPGRSRTYYLQDETEIDPWQSKLVVFLGVLMAKFGLIGLFLEKKLSRYH